MDEARMEAYVKYNRFYLEQRSRYKPNPFHHDNFHYNADEDYYIVRGVHILENSTKIGRLNIIRFSEYKNRGYAVNLNYDTTLFYKTQFARR